MISFPKKKYQIIYADPPWKYDNPQNSKARGGAIKHYNVMSNEELCNLPVQEITDTDCVLFLWTTSPKLEEAFPIIKAWGFEYKTSYVWDKVGHNMGHYNSVRHEFLLVCTKGNSTPQVKHLFDSVQSIRKSRRHSKKPSWFRVMINQLYPKGDRIELFARPPKDVLPGFEDRSYEGWDMWGDEVN